MQLFRKKVTSPPAVDAVFVFLKDQINREDLIAEYWASWERARFSQPFDQEQCVVVYRLLERFICDNKPLIVKSTHTKKTLRDAIGQAIPPETLPDYLQIFFVADSIRRDLLFRIASKVLVDLIETTQGRDRVHAIMSVSQGNARAAFTALYREVVSFLGEKTAQARIEESYQFIERAYGEEYLGDFFEIAPEELFATQRVSYFSQEKIGKEHQKVEAISQQNKILEDTKKAMINILEDARALEDELKKEKASVEQKVVERTRQLSEEQARFLAAINSMKRGFAIIDVSGAIPVANKSLLAILGTTGDHWTFKEFIVACGPHVETQALFNKCLSEKIRVVAEDIPLGKKFLTISMAPIISSGDTPIGVVINIDDITERKIMERSRDEFFSIASHELRTPLTAIRGNTSMILDNYASALTDPDLKEMIIDVHDSSIRLIDIVNDFLMTSRLEQGRMEFKKESFDLASLIHNALKEYQVTGSRSHIALTFEEPEKPLPAVFADPDRVRQVLINLIGNGLKFTESGSVVVSARQTDGLVQIMVTDTGRGISIGNQSLLFHKFQQAGSSILTRDTTKGTGLGLYISKLIIEGMGGNIWLVSSEVGKGSTFAFTLPVASS